MSIVIAEVEKVICRNNSPLNIKGEAIDIDHRIMKQQYTTLLPSQWDLGDRKARCMACQQKGIRNTDWRIWYVLWTFKIVEKIKQYIGLMS